MKCLGWENIFRLFSTFHCIEGTKVDSHESKNVVFLK